MVGWDERDCESPSRLNQTERTLEFNDQKEGQSQPQQKNEKNTEGKGCFTRKRENNKNGGRGEMDGTNKGA